LFLPGGRLWNCTCLTLGLPCFREEPAL
jgi:hypothetical protein